MQGRGYQAFIDRLADNARRDQRRHKQETVGRVLYAVIFAALLALSVGLVIQYFEARANLHRQGKALTLSLHEVSDLLDDIDKKMDATEGLLK